MQRTHRMTMYALFAYPQGDPQGDPQDPQAFRVPEPSLVAPRPCQTILLDVARVPADPEPSVTTCVR